MKKLLLLLLTFLFLVFGCSTTEPLSEEPVSGQDANPVARNGRILEVVSPSEVLVEAFGIYEGVGSRTAQKRKDVDKNGVSGAVLDARKTSVYLLLFGGSDPLLRDVSKRNKFEPFANHFFAEENLERYITFEESKFLSKLKLDEGTALKVSKTFKINKDLLISDLVHFRVLEAMKDITEALGNPIIMVIPAMESPSASLDDLLSEKTVKHSAGVLQSYLTAKGFDVVVADQMAALSDMVTMEQEFAGSYDVSYQIALGIGSDVYLTFSGKEEETSYGTSRYAATLSAYETTTARLLGSETGYSNSREGDLLVSVEEAFNDAIDKVIHRILSYWEKDLASGVQYKLVVSLPPYLDSYDIDTLQLAFMEAVSEISLKQKELILTKETIDYLLWVDPERYTSSLKLYMDIKKEFEQLSDGASLSRISSNRKLLQLLIEY